MTLRTVSWAEVALVAVVLLSLIAARNALLPWETNDFVYCLEPWTAYLAQHGFSGLGDSFANYNMPYLYLLYVGTLTPFDALTWVKLVGLVSDLALAVGCMTLIRRFGAGRTGALLVGGLVLLLPEVLLNSAAWGQADSTYGALVVWTIVAAMANREVVTWAILGLALSFKLQAAFVLPLIVVVHLASRWKLRSALVAAIVVIAADVPALIAGRSPISLASIYLDQANTPADLTMNAPSLYALFPESHHDLIKSAGLYFAIAVMSVLTALVLRASRRYGLSMQGALLFATSLTLLAPWVLPLMHERYFFVGNVLLFLCAFLRRRLVAYALAAQLIALLAYVPFLFKADPVLSLGVTAIAEGVIIAFVLRELFRETGALRGLAPISGIGRMIAPPSGTTMSHTEGPRTRSLRGAEQG
ncbi:hypothetical protein [uncultured Amnibacterium sp.]|uniref:hypothetical protein n=1 Tax=uncultured Amnibacterium sp. TaxID=1631851 RepID=UPI0035CA9626